MQAHRAFVRLFPLLLLCAIVPAVAAQWSCLNRCGSRNTFCFCDSDCNYYGDCCFDYRPLCSAPSFQFVGPSAMNPTGGTLVTVRGYNFGVNPSQVELRARTHPDSSGNPLPIASWNYSSLGVSGFSFVAPPGAGEDYVVYVKNDWGFSANSGTKTLSYSNSTKPLITDLHPTNGPAFGGTLVTLTGANFLTFGNSILLNGLECTIVFQSATSVKFITPAAYGTNTPVTVKAGLYTSNPVYYSVNPPAITSLSASSAGSAGGGTLTVVGHDFGPIFTPNEARNAITVGGSPCALTGSRNDTHLFCTLPSGNGTVPVVVTVGGQVSASKLFQYDNPPVIDSISPMNGPTAGGTLITVFGSSFNYSGIVVTLDDVPATVASIETNQIVFVSPSGFGVNKTIAVLAPNQLTATNSVFRYDPPTVLAPILKPPTVSTEGGAPITISGHNFGSVLSVIRVTIGGGDCQITSITPHSQLVCLVPPLIGADNALVVAVDTQSSAPLNFRYSPPVVTSIEPSQGPTSE